MILDEKIARRLANSSVLVDLGTGGIKMTDNDRELSLKMAEYLQIAMQSRRSIQLKVFTGTVVLFLLLARGAHELALPMNGNYDQFAELIKFGIVVTAVLFAISMFQIEAVSAKALKIEKYIGSFRIRF